MDDNNEEIKTNEEVIEEKNPIDEAKKILEETQKALSKITEERKRVEKATAEMLINGKSYAGQPQEKPKEETAKEYAERIMNNNKK